MEKMIKLEKKINETMLDENEVQAEFLKSSLNKITFNSYATKESKVILNTTINKKNYSFYFVRNIDEYEEEYILVLEVNQNFDLKNEELLNELYLDLIEIKERVSEYVLWG